MIYSMKDFKESLIAIALLILIPTTVHFGCNLLSPKIDYEQYSKERADFFKEYQRPYNQEEYTKRKSEWEKTDTFMKHHDQICKTKFNYLMIAGLVSVCTMYLGITFFMPIIASGLVVCSLVLLMWYSSGHKECGHVYGFNLFWIEFLFVFINLMFVLYASYMTSKNE